MSEAFVELLVARKPNNLMAFLKYVCIGLCVASLLFWFVSSSVVLLIVAVLFGVGAYFAAPRVNVEYEYLYLDKEITVDRVLNKEKRKRMAVYEVDKMEIIAPLKSYHMDDYKNRELKTVDYSSGIEGQPEKRFAFIYEGNLKVIFEPNEEMMKLIKNVAPRKTFLD